MNKTKIKQDSKYVESKNNAHASQIETENSK